MKPARIPKKVQVSKETKVWMQCLGTTAKLWVSRITHTHTHSISLRYIFACKIFSRGFQVVTSVEICQPKSCKSVRICHVPDVTSLHSSAFIYLHFRFRVQIMDFSLSFAPFSCLLFFLFLSQNILVTSLCKGAANWRSSLQGSNFTFILTKATCVVITKYRLVSFTPYVKRLEVILFEHSGLLEYGAMSIGKQLPTARRSLPNSSGSRHGSPKRLVLGQSAWCYVSEYWNLCELKSCILMVLSRGQNLQIEF